MLGQTRVASAQEKYAVTVLNECELRLDYKILSEEQYKLLSLFQTRYVHPFLNRLYLICVSVFHILTVSSKLTERERRKKDRRKERKKRWRNGYKCSGKKENTLTMLSIAPPLKYFNLMQIKGYSNNKVGQLPSTYQVPDNLHSMVHIFGLCKHMIKQL